MRRIVSFLMAIIVVALSCIPCSDADAWVRETGAHSAATTEQDHHQDEHAADFCSPFCACACCAVPVILPAPPMAFPLVAAGITGQRFNRYLPASISEIALPVWQPPQLG